MSDQEINRLRWRCRRGMRELDVLLLSYVDRRYAQADPDDKSAFRTLLSLPDPEILGLLMGRSRSDDERIQRIVEHVLDDRVPRGDRAQS